MMYTSSAAHHNENAWTVVLQKESVVRMSLEEKLRMKILDKVVGYHLLNILLGPDDWRIVCLGVKAARHDLRVLSFDPPAQGKKAEIETHCRLPMKDSDIYSASAYRGPTGLQVLVLSLTHKTLHRVYMVGNHKD